LYALHDGEPLPAHTCKRARCEQALLLYRIAYGRQDTVLEDRSDNVALAAVGIKAGVRNNDQIERGDDEDPLAAEADGSDPIDCPAGAEGGRAKPPLISILHSIP
jgi:hypothetical protein